MTLLPTVCIIGAGSSGIAAVKALHERALAAAPHHAAGRLDLGCVGIHPPDTGSEER